MASKVEVSASKMRELAASDLAQRLKAANEAETRLLLIDRVLEILGWSPEEYKPEQPTSTGRYTDYLLTLDGKPRLIVEAKRYGLVGSISKKLQLEQYTNTYLHKSCGEELSALLDQCRMYCSDRGMLYAVATTGNIWVVLVGFSTGIEWGKLRSFVFHSLEDISERFNQFYDLVSRESIKSNSLEEAFNSIILVKPSNAVRPRSRIDNSPDAKEVPYRRFINIFFDHYFSDITKSDREDMLEHCYVESREIIEFSRDLRVLLEYDTVLDEQDDPISEVSEEELRAEIEYQLTTGSPKTILLVGRVGSGKSTFVHRFVREQSRPENHVCIIIDLINRATVNVSTDRDEEQFLAELILDKLYDQFRDKFDPYDKTVLRGCFRKEVEQFKTRKPELYQRRNEEYALQEEQFLEELVKNKYKHLIGYAKYILKKKHKIWITLDNIDQGTDTYQAFIYSFAHRLSSDSGCVTLVTMREDTFVEAQASGFLNVRSTDFVFRLKSPELRQIIAKRRKYLNYMLENKKLPRFLSPHRKLIELLNWHIKALILGSNDTIRKVISAFSLGNIRFSLQILEDYYTSYHSLFHNHHKTYATSDVMPNDNDVKVDEEFAHFIQALMLRNSWSYDERDSEIANVFVVDQEEQSSHFIALLVLAYLSREQTSPKASVKVGKLLDDLIFLGYQRHHILYTIRRLLRASIILAPTIPLMRFSQGELPEIKGDSRITISAKGYYYLNHLVPSAYYQTRVAEDTVWYDEDRASLYIKALKESHEVQEKYASQDYLMATEAREIFMQYLKKAWLHDYQASRAKSQIEWARSVFSIVEERLFGKQITQSVQARNEDPSDGAERMIAHQPALIAVNKETEMANTKQLSIFPIEAIDYEKTFKENAELLGPMPKDAKFNKSTYILKVLWALELAFRCGFSGLRASDIALIINKYGNDTVAGPNVAKFFRNQKVSKEFTYLWKENLEGRYTINNFGRDLITAQTDDLRV